MPKIWILLTCISLTSLWAHAQTEDDPAKEAIELRKKQQKEMQDVQNKAKSLISGNPLKKLGDKITETITGKPSAAPQVSPKTAEKAAATGASKAPVVDPKNPDPETSRNYQDLSKEHPDLIKDPPTDEGQGYRLTTPDGKVHTIFIPKGEAPAEAVRRMLTNPNMKSVANVMENQLFVGTLQALWNHPDRDKFLIGELVVFILILIFKAWRNSDVGVTSVMRRMWIGTYVFILYMALAAVLVPYLVFGSLYWDLWRGLYDILITA